ncbi:MAG: tetratricopeptide repeat protein [Myxococcota bacterium]|nr:tetratricopeptide repeat protein [Myxococcota bacterium]
MSTRIAFVLVGLFTASLAEAAPNDGGVARNAFARGSSAMDAGRTEEARDAFATAREAAPDWGLAHLSFGIAEQTVDPDSARALDALEAAVRLEPENPKARYHLGLAYDRKGRFSDAAKQYAIAIERRPQLYDAQFQLANALRMSGDLTGAIGAFEVLLRGDPTHIGALSALSEVYENAQRLEDAEAALQTITRLQPNVAYHQYRLAKFYERTGNTNKAHAAYVRADSLKPQQQRKMRPLLPSR